LSRTWLAPGPRQTALQVKPTLYSKGLNLKKLVVPILILVAILVTGCAPRRVVEFEVSLGTLIDADSGFYAYTTSLHQNPVDSLQVALATEFSICGGEIVNSPESQEVYPIVAYIPSRSYVKPDQIESFLGIPAVDSPDSNTYQLGYFSSPIVGARAGDMLAQQKEESGVGGVAWILLDEKLSDNVRSVFDQVVEYAAHYGADALVDVALYFDEECSSCRDAGLKLEAKAIAFLE
jgi:hypothetical protein